MLRLTVIGELMIFFVHTYKRLIFVLFSICYILLHTEYTDALELYYAMCRRYCEVWTLYLLMLVVVIIYNLFFTFIFSTITGVDFRSDEQRQHSTWKGDLLRIGNLHSK